MTALTVASVRPTVHVRDVASDLARIVADRYGITLDTSSPALGAALGAALVDVADVVYANGVHHPDHTVRPAAPALECLPGGAA